MICRTLALEAVTLSLVVVPDRPGVIDVAIVGIRGEDVAFGRGELECMDHPDLHEAYEEIAATAAVAFPTWARVDDLIVVPLVAGPRTIGEA